MIMITNERPKWLTNNFVKWSVIGLAVAAGTFYIICEAVTFGNIQYLVKTNECHSKPVTLRVSTLPIGGEVPSYDIKTSPGWFDEKTGFTQLYCSIDEAKASKTGYNKFDVR